MPTHLYHIVEPVLHQLEKKRKKLSILAMPLLILAIGSGLVALLSFADVLFSFWLKDNRSLFLFAGCCILAFILAFRYGKIEQGYRRRSRRRFLASIFEALDCEVKPECREIVTADDLYATRLFAAFDRAETDCLVDAVHGHTPMQLFYVHTEYIYDTFTSKGRTQKKYRTLFKGTLMLIHPVQKWPVTLVVEPTNPSGGVLQRAVSLSQQAGLEPLSFEHGTFAEHFTCFADHPNLAHRLISEELLEEMQELEREIGTTIRFSYIGSVLCLVIGDADRDHKLDLGLTESLTNTDRVVHLSEEIAFGLELAKAFEKSSSEEVNPR